MADSNKDLIIHFNKDKQPERGSEKVYVTEEVDTHDTLRLFLDHQVPHVVNKNLMYFDEELSSGVEMLKNPDNYFKFPVATVLSPESVQEESNQRMTLCRIPFHRSDQKQMVLSKALEAIKQSGGGPRVILERSQLIIDELFTNVIYNAPFVGQGKLIDRTQKIVLPEDKGGEIIIGFKDQRTVISCRDFYGSLDMKKYLDRIARCYREGARQMMNQGEGGAGIGAYLIYNLSTSFYLGVLEGEQTLITSVLCPKSARTIDSQVSRHIHLHSPST